MPRKLITLTSLAWNRFTDHEPSIEVRTCLRCLQGPEKEMLREMRACTLFPAERSRQVPVGTRIIRKWPCRQTTTGSLDCCKF